LENVGLLRIVPEGALYDRYAHVSIPVNVPAVGQLLVQTNAYLNFRAGSRLDLAGTAEVQTGAVLCFANEIPASELALYDGALLTGTGTVRLYGTSRLATLGNATTAVALLDLVDSSRVTGTGTLRIDPEALLRINHSVNFPGSLDVAGTFTQTSSGVVNRIEGTLWLRSTGTLNAPGILSAGRFVDDGGTLNGNVITDDSLITTRWLNPAGGNWSVATNWSAGLPDPTRIAVVDLAGDYAITLDTSATVAELRFGATAGTQTLAIGGASLQLIGAGHFRTNTVLRLAGGTFGGNAEIVLDGTLTWTSGTISGSGSLTLNPACHTSIEGGGGKVLRRTVDNWGTVVWSGGNIDAREAVVNNRAGGVWELAGDQYFDDGVFNNQGTLVKTAGAADNQSTFRNLNASGGQFHNSGLVELQAGRLLLGVSGTHSGSFVLATNTTVTFASGTHALAEGCGFGGLGTVRFQTPIQLGTDVNFGTLNIVFEDSATLSGNYLLSNSPGGTITFAKSMTIPGSMTIAGTLSLADSSLTVTISGTFTLEPTGVLNNPGTLRAGAFVDNGGTIVGNEPVTIGLGSTGFCIDEIRIERSAMSTASARPGASWTFHVTLTWRAEDTHGVVIETSRDLRNWFEQSAVVREVAPGSFEATLDAPADTSCYFRIKCPTGPTVFPDSVLPPPAPYLP